uniref:Uncharacterized protein n=1 Tax=Eucheuma denticulatum TaxID=305493 RepID=A0A8E7PH30_9FLOR|nr:hypothetical protein [Eucheuma denticulatum]
MLINLFPIAFFNEYIISPKIGLHYVKCNKKIISLFFYLSYFYYIHPIYSILINLIGAMVITCLYFQFNNSHSAFAYYLMVYSIIKSINIKKLFIKINFNDTIIHQLFYKIINIRYTNIYLFLSNKLLIKIILIPVTCFICLKVLFSTTKYEHTIGCAINLLQYFKIFTSMPISFLITLSSQVLLLFSNKISYLIISIHLRNMHINFINQYIKSSYSLLRDFLNFSDSRIKIISLIICLRNIKHSRLVFMDL